MAAFAGVKETYWKWLLIAPAVAFLLIFAIVPLIWSFGISFYNYASNIFGKPPEFIGSANYIAIMTHPDIWLRFQNTARFAVTVVALEFILGLTLAILLYKPFKGHRYLVTLFILPMMMAPEMIAMSFKVILFDTNIGFMNYFVSNVLRIPFNGYGPDAFPAIVMIDIWTWTPFVMLITLGGMSSVPKPVLEAADVDGAGMWAKFRYVVLPYARPFILLALIFRFADALRTWEVIREWIEVPPPMGPDALKIDLLPSYLYNIGFRAFKVSEMSAIGIIIFLMAIVLVYTYLRYLKRVEQI